MTNQEGNRRFKRKAVRKPIRVKVDIPGSDFSGTAFASLSKNISEGGMFIFTTMEFEVGTKLRVLFKLPIEDSPSIDTTVEVRWSSGPDSDAQNILACT